MSDLNDVMNELVAVVVGIVYPNGIAAPSIVGSLVRIYPGWPIPLQLDADLKAHICHVSIYPRPEESNSTRYATDWQEASFNSPTLTLLIAGQSVVVGGVMPLSGNPHNLVVVANGVSFIYSAQPTDSLASIAQALAGLIAALIPGTISSGAVITLPPSARLSAVRIGVTGTSLQEVRRQERLIQIGIWADSPQHRTALVAPIDAKLAALPFLTMPDTSAARLRYKSSPISDVYEKSTLFRRDLMYEVEYGTYSSETDAQITALPLNVAAAFDQVFS